MFAERLKQLRKESGLTQKQVAESLQVAQNSYSNWEKGIRTPLNPTIDKLAELFNVSSEYLKGNSDIRNPEEDIDLSDFEILYRNTSKGLSDEDKAQLEVDLKKFLLERQRLINAREKARNSD
ncbi:helix-turn-helix domain-containing protein [Streptococcus oriscaviae]|uniref:Helix-turn-helix domain-containing protein n=1 Tax=Streptococcus oriscaviae TaxID=2781599 RepID=A0ABX7YIE2_9STRE|nr:helix-turn-helix transcriptional regulator [Streptococcus oriscaviae]QUE53572.1 helix-turn-helix domain-containing protein [Streptococcus oriscaviae]